MSGLLCMGTRAAWPARPTRDEALSQLRVLFQGFTAQSRTYGRFPAFGPETSTLADDDLRWYFQQAKDQGATAVEFAVSWRYSEPGYSYPIPGRDYSGGPGLVELKRRIAIAIQEYGFRVLLFCAGDGEGAGPAYNDPNGATYGRTWLMHNFQRIYDAMGPTAAIPQSVRPWLVFLPGYDATDAVSGWVNPSNVIAWWRYARQVIDAGGEGYLGQEWSAGVCTLGDSVNAYAPDTGQHVDVFLQEFPVGPLPGDAPDATWQILGRMVQPYHRPPEQPAGDDPHPPFLLAPGTPRGPFYYYAYEFLTYKWVRNWCSVADVEHDRAYLAQLGATRVC